MNAITQPLAEFLGAFALSFSIRKSTQKYLNTDSFEFPLLIQEIAIATISALSNILFIKCGRHLGIRLGYPLFLGGIVYSIFKIALFFFSSTYYEQQNQKIILKKFFNSSTLSTFSRFLRYFINMKNIYWLKRLYFHLEKDLSEEDFRGFQIHFKEAILDTRDEQFLIDLTTEIPTLKPFNESLKHLVIYTPEDTALTILDFLNPVIPIIDGTTLQSLGRETRIFQAFQEEDTLLQRYPSGKDFLENAVKLSGQFTITAENISLFEIFKDDLT